MPSSQRIFVDAIKKYCTARGISVDVRSDGWLIVMQRGRNRHVAFGYDLGLNSAIAHRIANDKAATSEMLQLGGIACVPHTSFLNPKLNVPAAATGSWRSMLALLERSPQGLVVKPNEGTSGRSVFRVTTPSALELAVLEIFGSHMSLAISPYLDIDDEVRVVLLDKDALAVYSKNRDKDWRHNLEFGARPVLLEQGEAREAPVAIAIEAAKAIDIRFSSIDVVRVGGRWQVLEINSGVMMETLGKLYPELVYAIYSAALDKVFG